MKLYYVPKSRAVRPRWVLEELGVPYELVRLDPSKGETHTAEHLARHPLGHVPVLEDGEVRLFESIAICMYLADRFADRGLAPPPGTRERALYYQWLLYAATEVEPPLAALGAQLRRAEAERDLRVIDAERERMVKAVRVLEPVLVKGPYLQGEHFSVADVVLGTMLILAKSRGGLSSLPAVETWLERLEQRPARRRAIAD